MKPQRWLQRTARALPLAVLCTLFIPPHDAIAATSYLQELEAEAARTDDEESATDASEAPQSDWSADKQTLSESIEAGLSKAKFEERLKQSYYGSYLFYSTLDDTAQASVYSDYQNNNDIESIRESIKTNMKK